MDNQNEKKKPRLSPGKIVALVLVVLFSLPAELIAVLIFLGIIGFVGYLGFKSAKNAAPPRSSKQEVFDDCPKPICFHKDKGEHHVKRGREIDPWDRPDIDISKYQRKR